MLFAMALVYMRISAGKWLENVYFRTRVLIGWFCEKTLTHWLIWDVFFCDTDKQTIIQMDSTDWNSACGLWENNIQTEWSNCSIIMGRCGVENGNHCNRCGRQILMINIVDYWVWRDVKMANSFGLKMAKFVWEIM
jgi:hypothetical protein